LHSPILQQAIRDPIGGRGYIGTYLALNIYAEGLQGAFQILTTARYIARVSLNNKIPVLRGVFCARLKDRGSVYLDLSIQHEALSQGAALDKVTLDHQYVKMDIRYKWKFSSRYDYTLTYKLPRLRIRMRIGWAFTPSDSHFC
jgi:hypothetical protein